MTPSMSTGAMSPKQNIAGFGLKQPKHLRQVPQFNPGQMNLFQSLLGGVQPGSTQGLDFLSKLAGGNEEMFNQLEAPAFSNYQKTLGDLGSRFAQFGGVDSSAFQNAVTGAGADLAQNLQSQRSQLQSDAISKLLGYSGQLLGQRPYEIVQQGQREGNAGNIGNMLGQYLPSILAALASLL